jgi:hypothetical protein
MALNLRDEEWMEKRRTWCALLDGVARAGCRGAMEAAETLASEREEVLKFLRWAESWYRDLLVHGVTQDRGRIVNLDLSPELSRHAQRCGGGRAVRVLDEITAAIAAIQRNLNRRLVLEKFLFAATDAD